MHFQASMRGLLCLGLVSLIAAQTQPTLAQLATLTTDYETSQHAFPKDPFYNVPGNFTDRLPPGTLLKVEPATNLTNYTVPASLSMSRILYTTTDVHGAVLPASAYILWPCNTLPNGDIHGYPVVAWAHGTSGTHEPCAPSNYRSLQYHFMVPYLLATQGHVVVAADYAGLGVGHLPNGTRIRHPWATSPAQANDVAWAVVAARAAFPEHLARDGPFVTMGHSEGGRAAWAFAERQAVSPVPGYMGTVVFAPPPDAIAQIEQALQDPTARWSADTQLLQPLTIDAITAVYPSYNWKGLTNVTSQVFNEVYEPSQGCLPTESVLFGSIPLTELASPGWTQDPDVRRWRNLTQVGRKNFAGPLLLLAGVSDSIIPYNDSISSSVLSTVQATCDLLQREHSAESLELVGYQHMDHFPVIQASQGRWLAWVKDRLSGTLPALPGGCTIGEVAGFRTAYTAMSGAEPNFLVEWTNNTWEYTL